jgi:glycerol uptake facilitator-like aquaporin
MTLARSATAEAVGTALLLAVGVGSGIAPQSVPVFLIAQLIGGFIAAVFARWLGR